MIFQHMKRHSKIMVTGPQRSGTTICARMIAHDTGHTYFDENQIGIDNQGLWQNLFLTQSNFVVQAPGLAHVAHEFPGFVVWMQRAVVDIIASQKRIGWGFEDHELRKYRADHGPIAQVKYDFWREMQRSMTAKYQEVRFSDLVHHPFFVHRDKRAGFGPRQWSADV